MLFPQIFNYKTFNAKTWKNRAKPSKKIRKNLGKLEKWLWFGNEEKNLFELLSKKFEGIPREFGHAIRKVRATKKNSKVICLIKCNI